MCFSAMYRLCCDIGRCSSVRRRSTTVGWEKHAISYFWRISSKIGYTSKASIWHQDRWPWMTLNCRPISSNFHRISQISDTTTAKRMKSSIVSDNVVSNWMYFSTWCSLRSFEFFARGPSYTHCWPALTLALARLSYKVLLCNVNQNICIWIQDKRRNGTYIDRH